MDSGGLWISPDWEVYDTGFGLHDDYANEVFDSDPTELENQGWIRINWDNTGAVYIQSGRVDESKFNHVLRILREHEVDQDSVRFWEVYQGRNAKGMEATKEGVEEYGDIWRALVRGRRIRGSLRKAIIRFANKILMEE